MPYDVVPIRRILAPLAGVAFWLVVATAGAENLEQAWATALTADYRLEATRWSTSAAGHSLEAARASRLPNVWVRGGYAVRSDEQSFRITTPLTPQTTFPYIPREGFQFGGNIRLPLYTSGQIQHGIDAAAEHLTSAKRNEQRTVQGLKFDVAEAYVAVLRAQRQLDVTARAEQSIQSHLDDINRRHAQELARRNDLLASRVALLDAHQVAVAAFNRLDLARAGYNRLLGRPLGQRVVVDDLTIPNASNDLDLLTARALAQRPELGGLAAEMRSLRHQAESLLAATKPQVGVDGGYQFMENQFQTPQGIASAMVGAEWNLFDGGVKRRQAQALCSQAEAVKRLLADMQSSIALDVREAWLMEQESRQRVDIARQGILHAEENLKVAKDRYRNGLATNSDVLAAESLQTQSAGNYHNAVYDAVLSSLRLRRAVGDL
jgi:outer membrane protein